MSWAINPADLTALEAATAPIVVAQQGAAQPHGTPWGSVDEHGDAKLAQDLFDGWNTYLSNLGHDFATFVQTATGKTIAELQAKPWSDLQPKILKFAQSPIDDFRAINFKTHLAKRLHPRRTFGTDRAIRGELIKVEYYENVTEEADGSFTWSNLILQEDFVYTRDGQGIALSRTQTITWYREDGTAHPSVKTMSKVYIDDRTREGQRRRANIMNIASASVFGALTDAHGEQAGYQMGKLFFESIITEIAAYKDTSARTIVDTTLPAATETWLDSVLVSDFGNVSVRVFLIDWLNIWDFP